jgi:tRNA-dihydrouridine synthase B
MKFSSELQAKIDTAKAQAKPIKLGSLDFDSNLLLAPMASICNWPFRLLMEDLGCGGTVSELISCHGINYGNQKTLDMLRIDKRERNIGIQLFGEDPEAMAKSVKVAQEVGPKFIDINMGCPVKKVVSKGGGSALLKDPKSLAILLSSMKKSMDVPLTIKIRMGWDADQINADEIVNVAYNEGVEMVAIHGRTRAQQYTGQANWNYIEKLASEAPLPIIGNGDLHQAYQVRERMAQTHCEALMIARGCLRNPFIFLESLDDSLVFTSRDYWEAIERLFDYTAQAFEQERTRLVQMRKLIVWFSAGFPNTKAFRGKAFATQTLDECMKLCEEYFLGLDYARKRIDYNESFMTSGHG